MSTYGGDSWVPEAMHRKHQVDQVLADVHHLDRYSAQWRRLSNGRLTCLVCPHRPVLDTFPMLITHREGAKHRAAAAKQEEKDCRLQNEIQKRIALEAYKATECARRSQHRQSSPSSASSPLVEATRKRTAQALAMPNDFQAKFDSNTTVVAPYRKQKSGPGTPFFTPAYTKVPSCPVNVVKTSASAEIHHGNPGKRKQGQKPSLPSQPVSSKEDQDRRMEQERLLRLREAGWRVDGNGKWFKDESVEFDSDEETPADLS